MDREDTLPEDIEKIDLFDFLMTPRLRLWIPFLVGRSLIALSHHQVLAEGPAAKLEVEGTR